MKRQHIALILAIVAGFAAVILLNQHIKNIKRSVKEETLKGIGQAVKVVTATKEIKQGQRVEDYMLGYMTVPSNFRQPNALRSVEEAIGKMAAVAIVPGEQISSTQLTAKKLSPMGGLSVRIPSGKRAITFPMDKLSAVGGMVKPGDYVDIMGTFPVTKMVDGKPVVEPILHTFLQNVLILAVDEELGAGATKGETATLALSPLEAQLVTYAQQQGKIRFVLRSPLDTSTEPVVPVDSNALAQYIAAQMGLVQEQLPGGSGELPPVPKGPSVEIYRGQNKEEIPLREK